MNKTEYQTKLSEFIMSCRCTGHIYDQMIIDRPDGTTCVRHVVTHAKNPRDYRFSQYEIERDGKVIDYQSLIEDGGKIMHDILFSRDKSNVEYGHEDGLTG